jgi:hypothetical protein
MIALLPGTRVRYKRNGDLGTVTKNDAPADSPVVDRILVAWDNGFATFETPDRLEVIEAERNGGKAC